jgi:16S rRNA (cytosine1402-N4)-methyltransferase
MTPLLAGHDQPAHEPVLLDMVLQFLMGSSPSILVDGTVGGGGHLRGLLKRCPPQARILAVDRDPSAIEPLLTELGEDQRLVLRRASYTQVPEILSDLDMGKANGALFDLGLSSIQLDSPERGFSYRVRGPLDMRYDPGSEDPTAAEILDRLSEEEIADMIYEYGQERRSRRIAKAMAEAGPLRTTGDLVRAVTKGCRRYDVKAMSRVFQALRIKVNRELEELDALLGSLGEWMEKDGRVAFLTFHSLEDRRVKRLFADSDRFRPAEPAWIAPGPEERRDNPRSRSAKLRMGIRT